MDFFVARMQVVLFGQVVLGKKVQVAAELSNQLADLFDEEPILLPVPDDVPAEIPRIILRSKDGKHSSNISFNRAEFVYTEKDKLSRELQGIREEFLTSIGNFAKVLIKSRVIVKVSRLGSITELVTFTEDDPIEIIQRNFLRTEDLGELSQIDLGLLAKMTWDNIKVNRWHRFRAGTAEMSPEGKPCVNFVVDINTVPEIEYDFDLEGITGFYSRVYTNIGSNLSDILRK